MYPTTIRYCIQDINQGLYKSVSEMKTARALRFQLYFLSEYLRYFSFLLIFVQSLEQTFSKSRDREYGQSVWASSNKNNVDINLILI